jgi:hypothetical protein
MNKIFSSARGCKAWEMWKSKLTICSPNYYACSMASNVTCEPLSSRTNRCQFDGELPFRIYLLKNERNSLNKKVIIQAFACISMHVPNL